MTTTVPSVGPDNDELQSYYANQNPRRLELEYAVQQKPLGTADAVAAAADFAGADSFVVINSDNYYPVAALQA